MTRGQMAAFLVRALDLTPIDPPPPVAGNPTGHVPIPAAAGLDDTSDPDRVVGTGTPASCTSQAVVGAVGPGRRDHLQLRARAGDDPDERDRAGLQQPARTS